jgi:ABC-type multidrug transport system ATPase subunit
MGLMHTPNNTITITTNELSYAPDKTQLYPFLTAREQMRMIYDIHKLPSKPARNHIDKLLNQVGLDPANNTRIGNYSSGMKKRL